MSFFQQVPFKCVRVHVRVTEAVSLRWKALQESISLIVELTPNILFLFFFFFEKYEKLTSHQSHSCVMALSCITDCLVSGG